MLIVPSTHFYDILRLALVVNDYLQAMLSSLLKKSLLNHNFQTKNRHKLIIHASKILGITTVYLSAMAN